MALLDPGNPVASEGFEAMALAAQEKLDKIEAGKRRARETGGPWVRGRQRAKLEIAIIDHQRTVTRRDVVYCHAPTINWRMNRALDNASPECRTAATNIATWNVEDREALRQFVSLMCASERVGKVLREPKGRKIQVRLEAHIYEACLDAAGARGLTLSEWIRKTIDAYCENTEVDIEPPSAGSQSRCRRLEVRLDGQTGARLAIRARTSNLRVCELVRLAISWKLEGGLSS